MAKKSFCLLSTKSSLALTIFLLLLLVTPASSALWCFQCDSRNTPECGDDFSAATSNQERVSCMDGAYSCIKRRGSEKYGEGVSRIFVQRACVGYRSDGCFDEHLYGIDLHSCVCNSNFCNGGVRLAAFPAWAVLLIGVVFLVSQN